MDKKARCNHKIWSTTGCDYIVSVHKTNQYVYLQLDHVPTRKTIMSMSSKVVSPKKVNVAIASQFGAKFVEQLKQKLSADLPAVAFNRSGYKYHGKVKAVAEAARANGLRF